MSGFLRTWLAFLELDSLEISGPLSSLLSEMKCGESRSLVRGEFKKRSFRIKGLSPSEPGLSLAELLADISHDQEGFRGE